MHGIMVYVLCTLLLSIKSPEVDCRYFQAWLVRWQWLRDHQFLSVEVAPEEKKTDLFSAVRADHTMSWLRAPAAKKTLARSLTGDWHGEGEGLYSPGVYSDGDGGDCTEPGLQVYHHNGQSLYSHRRVGMTGGGPLCILSLGLAREVWSLKSELTKIFLKDKHWRWLKSFTLLPTLPAPCRSIGSDWEVIEKWHFAAFFDVETILTGKPPVWLAVLIPGQRTTKCHILIKCTDFNSIKK